MRCKLLTGVSTCLYDLYITLEAENKRLKKPKGFLTPLFSFCVYDSLMSARQIISEQLWYFANISICYLNISKCIFTFLLLLNFINKKQKVLQKLLKRQAWWLQWWDLVVLLKEEGSASTLSGGLQNCFD